MAGRLAVEDPGALDGIFVVPDNREFYLGK